MLPLPDHIVGFGNFQRLFIARSQRPLTSTPMEIAMLKQYLVVLYLRLPRFDLSSHLSKRCRFTRLQSLNNSAAMF